ncbi:MAG: hypothetical protein QXW20_07870 [Ignisphaera sp.]
MLKRKPWGSQEAYKRMFLAAIKVVKKVEELFRTAVESIQGVNL